MIVGPTMSGKTRFMYEVLRNAGGMFEVPPEKIVYAYAEYQPLFDDMEEKLPHLVLHQGLPTGVERRLQTHAFGFR